MKALVVLGGDLFSVQVLGAVDAVIVGTHDHAAGFVVVGVGEVVFFGALVGDADAC